MRTTISWWRALRAVVGRPIEVGAIVPSWWPLGVRLHDVTIGEDAAFGTEPFLRAEGVVMGVRPWPLIHGRIEAAGVTLDRPRLSLVRDRSARWNVESLGLAADDGGNGKSKSKESRLRRTGPARVGGRARAHGDARR